MNESGNHPQAVKRRYRLKARILCHDVRLSDEIETVVALAAAPSAAEAEQLLLPAANALVDRNGGEGCNYDLSDVRVMAESG